MSDRPRRRSTQRARAPKPFPFIPMVVAVSLAGFVIGASFALFARAHGGPPAPLATPSLPPAITPSPFVSGTAASSPSASPQATPSASPSASASPSSTPSPTPSPSPSDGPAAAPVASSAAPASSAPSVGAGAALTAPSPSDDADSDFARLAAVVVRQYLAALKRGDDASAYGAFGTAPGASGVSFVEKRYVDRTTRIVRVSSSGTDDAATVDVDLETGGTTYFAQYVLTRSASGAAIIQRHTIVKP